MELLLVFLNVLIILLLTEGVVYGIALLFMTRCIAKSHEEDKKKGKKKNGKVCDDR